MENSIKEKQSNYVTHFYNDRVFEAVYGLPSMSNNSIEVSKELIALSIKYQNFNNKNTFRQL